MVTNLKAMSFGSVSLIPFTAPVRFFDSLCAQVVEVRTVMVGWLCSRLLHQISVHKEIPKYLTRCLN